MSKTNGRRRNTFDVFWSRVNIGNPTDCWRFLGAHDNDGYGKCRVAPDDLAHRVAFRAKNGDIPLGAHVLHKCDVRDCCNPDHLFLGNHSVNMKDMWDKHRHQRPIGERNNHAKLTAKQVLEIRTIYKNGEATQVELGKRFGVSQTMIGCIIHRKNWTHI